jgi:hypothetical protein
MYLIKVPSSRHLYLMQLAATNSHSALYLTCSNHASSDQPTDETTKEGYVAQDAFTRNKTPNHAKTATLLPFRLLPSLTSIFSRMKRTIIGLRPPFHVLVKAALDILGSFSCSKGTSAEDGRALNTFSDGTTAFSCRGRGSSHRSSSATSRQTARPLPSRGLVPVAP